MKGTEIIAFPDESFPLQKTEEVIVDLVISTDDDQDEEEEDLSGADAKNMQRLDNLCLKTI